MGSFAEWYLLQSRQQCPSRKDSLTLVLAYRLVSLVLPQGLLSVSSVMLVSAALHNSHAFSLEW
jgi:hypothetical protein